MGKVHVFPYSPRPGTAAAAMEGRPPADKLRERARRLRELSDRLSPPAPAGGQGDRVLVERRHPDGTVGGLGADYTRFVLPAGAGAPGEMVAVAVEGLAGDHLSGRPEAVPDLHLLPRRGGKAPATVVVARDGGFLAFEDVSPKAPVHLLVIPERHVDSIAGVEGLSADERAAMLPFIAATRERRGARRLGLPGDDQPRAGRPPERAPPALAHPRRHPPLGQHVSAVGPTQRAQRQSSSTTASRSSWPASTTGCSAVWRSASTWRSRCGATASR